MKGTNGKAKKVAGDLTAGWVKLATVLVANTEFRAALDAFLSDPETLALREASPGLCRELHSIHEVLTESLGITTERAAGAVAR